MFTAPAAPVESPAQRAAAFTARAHDFAQRAAASLTDAGRAYNSAQAAKYLRIVAFSASRVEAIAQPEPVEVPAPLEAPRAMNAVDLAAEADIEAMRERGRQKREEAKPTADACRVRIMRAFFGAAKRAGLDCKAREAMTEALSKYLGCIIPSRSILSAGQWAEAVAAVELGLLAW